MLSSYLLNVYATRHILSANILFIFLSIDEAHMRILLLSQILSNYSRQTLLQEVTTDIGQKTNHPMYLWLQRVLTFDDLSTTINTLLSLKCIETNKHKSKRQKIRTKHEYIYKQIHNGGNKRLNKSKIKY
jgi:hypothetical protein